jgi:UDP-GlcNAc3NAcA epimerase
MKVLTVVGARPQFIKAAVVSRALKNKNISEVIVHTGQHYDSNMSEVFFDELQIPHPHYNLGIAGSGHGAATGQMLEKIEEVLIKEKPDAVMVYGDTNSTLAGALAARKLNIKLVHVEAGLRSFEMTMPEEINRILTDRISDVLFCPTETAVCNLKQEGFDHFKCSIIRSGDVMQDAAIYYERLSEEKSSIIQQLGLTRFVLATIHRAENTDNINNLRSIVAAFNEINDHMQVVVPLHPRTAKIIAKEGISCNFTIIEPVGYLDMVQLLKNCMLVMTDSGGLQKEAFFFKKHCVTLREQTEWVELVEHGFNTIAGTATGNIVEAYKTMAGKTSDFNIDLYGQG